MTSSLDALGSYGKAFIVKGSPVNLPTPESEPDDTDDTRPLDDEPTPKPDDTRPIGDEPSEPSEPCLELEENPNEARPLDL